MCENIAGSYNCVCRPGTMQSGEDCVGKCSTLRTKTKSPFLPMCNNKNYCEMSSRLVEI